MEISKYTQDVINLIGEFHCMANAMSHIGGYLGFPALPNGEGEGESELNDAIDKISEILNGYVASSIEKDACAYELENIRSGEHA